MKQEIVDEVKRFISERDRPLHAYSELKDRAKIQRQIELAEFVRLINEKVSGITRVTLSFEPKDSQRLITANPGDKTFTAAVDLQQQ